MKNLWKFIILASVSLLLIGCGNGRKLHRGEDENYGAAMYAYTQIVNNHQLDSICAVDTLAPVGTWLPSSYVDYETGKRLVKYSYFKCISERSEIVYILVPQDTLYKITKRVVTE